MWTARLAEHWLSRQVSDRVWTRRVDRELDAKERTVRSREGLNLIECLRGRHRGWRNLSSSWRFSRPAFDAAKWASSVLRILMRLAERSWFEGLGPCRVRTQQGTAEEEHHCQQHPTRYQNVWSTKLASFGNVLFSNGRQGSQKIILVPPFFLVALWGLQRGTKLHGGTKLASFGKSSFRKVDWDQKDFWSLWHAANGIFPEYKPVDLSLWELLRCFSVICAANWVSSIPGVEKIPAESCSGLLV